jgi:hypothetical protein
MTEVEISNIKKSAQQSYSFWPHESPERRKLTLAQNKLNSGIIIIIIIIIICVNGIIIIINIVLLLFFFVCMCTFFLLVLAL